MNEQTVLKVQMPTQVVLKLSARNLGGDAGTPPPSLAGVFPPHLISFKESKAFYCQQPVFSIMTPPF
jgi:hypothetical protein